MNLQSRKDARVAFLGPIGTYSHAAVLDYFGDKPILRECPNIDDVFASLNTGNADFAVVPVENSTEGAVNNTLDCLVDMKQKIVGEIVVPIEHYFMTQAETDLAYLKKIISHRQSLAQCRKWLAINHPDVEQVECASNGEAAKLAARDSSAAAIAGKTAAQLYGLEIRAEKIQDLKNNSTRFLVLASAEMQPTGKDKTSTLIYTENKPGSLFHILEPFEQFQVNLTRIETRPSRKEIWDYVFFVDFEGHIQDGPVQQVLDKLKGCTAEVKLLGSYPAANRIR